MNRSADWLHQAQADLELAGVSAAAGHHEWACFACHQAVEKALKGLHLRHGQQAWGHGLGRSWRDLPPAVSAALEKKLTFHHQETCLSPWLILYYHQGHSSR